jgi:hypothetical protein
MADSSSAELQRRLHERVHEEDGETRINCEEALALAAELGVAPAVVGDLCDAEGIKIRRCQLNCFH